jgi:hypothetical protein
MEEADRMMEEDTAEEEGIKDGTLSPRGQKLKEPRRYWQISRTSDARASSARSLHGYQRALSHSRMILSSLIERRYVCGRQWFQVQAPFDDDGSRGGPSLSFSNHNIIRYSTQWGVISVALHTNPKR